MVESYEVTLLLMSDERSPYNPKFGFHNEGQAISLMQIFVNQGYDAKIKITYQD